MFVSGTLFIVSFTIVCCTIVTKERIINESSIVTSNNICKNPEDFPLFGKNSCVTPTLYTSLFLISIILSSIIFLILIGLLILLNIRRLRRRELDFEESIIPNLVNPENNNNAKTVTSANKSDKEISSVLKKIVNTRPQNCLTQSHIHHSFPIPTSPESLLSSSNSYGDSYSNIDQTIEGQSKPKIIIPTISEGFELNTRESSERSSLSEKDSYDNQPKYSTKL